MVLQDDFTLDFDDQNDVKIQFIDGEDFPLANFTEHRASDHEFYSDESELSSEDSSEDEEGNDERTLGHTTPEARADHECHSTFRREIWLLLSLAQLLGNMSGDNQWSMQNFTSVPYLRRTAIALRTFRFTGREMTKGLGGEGGRDLTT